MKSEQVSLQRSILNGGRVHYVSSFPADFAEVKCSLSLDKYKELSCPQRLDVKLTVSGE